MHIPDKPDFESIYDDFIGNQPQPNLQKVKGPQGHFQPKNFRQKADKIHNISNGKIKLSLLFN